MPPIRRERKIVKFFPLKVVPFTLIFNGSFLELFRIIYFHGNIDFHGKSFSWISLESLLYFHGNIGFHEKYPLGSLTNHFIWDDSIYRYVNIDFHRNWKKCHSFDPRYFACLELRILIEFWDTVYTLAGKCLHFITGDDRNTKLSMAGKQNIWKP